MIPIRRSPQSRSLPASISESACTSSASKPAGRRSSFAEAAGITTTYTSDLEQVTKVPRLTILLRISRAFRRSVADLLSEFTLSRSIFRLAADPCAIAVPPHSPRERVLSVDRGEFPFSVTLNTAHPFFRAPPGVTRKSLTAT